MSDHVGAEEANNGTGQPVTTSTAEQPKPKVIQNKLSSSAQTYSGAS